MKNRILHRQLSRKTVNTLEQEKHEDKIDSSQSTDVKSADTQGKERRFRGEHN